MEQRMPRPDTIQASAGVPMPRSPCWRHWFSWMGTVLPFEIIHLCHLNLEHFLHRQPPLEDAQGDSGNFSGGKMDPQEIMHHPVHP
jgi:hypothetical protein